MTERVLPPLEPWAVRAKTVFWWAIGLITLLRYLDYLGLIERVDRPWLWIHNACVPTWMVAAVIWAFGAWRRRRRPPPADDAEAETPPT